MRESPARKTTLSILATKMQSRLQSLLESIANILIGMGIAFAAQLIVFPALGLVVRLDQNVAITVAFTAVSLVRSYVLRRLFNRLHTGGMFQKYVRAR